RRLCAVNRAALRFPDINRADSEPRKVSSARSEPFAAIRRRGLAEAGVRAVGVAAATDQIDFLGLEEADLTPAVRAALATLAIEIDDLRAELRRLKARLIEAEAA